MSSAPSKPQPHRDKPSRWLWLLGAFFLMPITDYAALTPWLFWAVLIWTVWGNRDFMDRMTAQHEESKAQSKPRVHTTRRRRKRSPSITQAMVRGARRGRRSGVYGWGDGE